MSANRIAALCAGLALTLLAAGAAEAVKPSIARKSVKEIRACMANNLVKRGALRDLALARTKHRRHARARRHG